MRRKVAKLFVWVGIFAVCRRELCEVVVVVFCQESGERDGHDLCGCRDAGCDAA
jgi:hypothetical protein